MQYFCPCARGGLKHPAWRIVHVKPPSLSCGHAPAHARRPLYIRRAASEGTPTWRIRGSARAILGTTCALPLTCERHPGMISLSAVPLDTLSLPGTCWVSSFPDVVTLILSLKYNLCRRGIHLCSSSSNYSRSRYRSHFQLPRRLAYLNGDGSGQNCHFSPHPRSWSPTRRFLA